MDKAIVEMAKDIAPGLEKAVDDYMKSLGADCRTTREAAATILWDNKVGILRVLQAVAAES